VLAFVSGGDDDSGARSSVVLERLGELGQPAGIDERAELLAVAVEPRAAGRETLSRRAADNGVRLLVGSRDDIDDLVARFGLMPRIQDGELIHATRVAVVGRDGTVRGVLDGIARWGTMDLRALVAAALRD